MTIETDIVSIPTDIDMRADSIFKVSFSLEVLKVSIAIASQ